jgi:hypothetical protein
MERRPESDFLVEAEEQFQVTAELWLEYALVVEELTSPSAKLVMYGTQWEPKEEEHGQELEVLPWIQSTILMVVVTNNILVTPRPSADTLHQVKRSV